MNDRIYRLLAILVMLAVVGIARPGSAETDFDYTDVFFKTFTETCMPAAHSNTLARPAGFIEMPDELAQLWLRGAPGSVWQVDATHDVLLVSYANFQCFVVSRQGDVEDLEQRVRKWFEVSAPKFINDQFKQSDDGGFSTSYSRDNADGTRSRVLIHARPPAEGRIQLLATAGTIKAE